MNIKQNIVSIKTATQMSSGIIYPCEILQDDFGDSNFIIFTNRHAVEDLPKDNEKLMLAVDFEIYDRNGSLLKIPKSSEEKKVELQLFYQEFDGKCDEEIEDIAAFLLTFHYKIDMDLERKILWDDIDLKEIFMEGFPQILSDNQISSKIQLQGIYKPIFPTNNKIGVFQITDDYHWYSNYKDMRLFQGFSGSPIYNKDGDSNCIVGMNQSILNIGDGENPFKLLYYYKFRFILEYLREQECIIFKRNKEQSISIRWIYNKKDSKNKTELSNINLLLLGASGAGKSSFAKTFLLHSDYIDSTNDGQTTRSNIIYEVSTNNLEPKIKIKFLNKEQFIKRMVQLNYSNYLHKILSLLYKEVSTTSLEGYLQYFYMEERKECCDIRKNIKRILLPTDNSKYNYKQEYYGKLFDACEKIISYKIEEKNIEAFINENEKDFKKIFSQVEGFFYESEFEFLGEIEKQERDGINKTEFNEYFNSYYGCFYEKIKEILLKRNIISENNYPKEILLKDEKKISELVPVCLQVKDKHSLTGIVDYVHIIDYISNEYSFIMDDLGIKSLKLIDTYGLDHANWDEEKSSVLSNIIYNLVEKRLIRFDSSLAVAYIKKLDAGKPTELKSIIPRIYNMIPQAPVFCIFNGLDIFLDSKIDQFQSCEYFYSSNQYPKAIQYINSEIGKNDILNAIKGNDGFKENLYNTLRNNIISFCSNNQKINTYYSLYENNRQQIYKLLLSICMKEYSSMNIIPETFIKDLKNKKHDDDIEELIEQIFEKSSKTDWEQMHWNTRKANYGRISENKELGYWGTYAHRWNQLFHIGYINAITKDEINLLHANIDPRYFSAIDSCIKNMENKFLGPAYQLAYIKTDEIDEKKCKFRELIEKMYSLGVKEGDFKFNPFSNSKFTPSSDSNADKDKKKVEVDFLNDVCDFKKGYHHIKRELIDYFRECLLDTIAMENKAKSQNLLKINPSFYNQYKKLKFEFNKKYENVKFEELMKNIYD